MSNIIPLNIASLGDEVIIKKGSGSGGELEGEYYLARPNGWYWRHEQGGLYKGNDEVIIFIMRGLYSAVVNGELLNVPSATAYICSSYVSRDYSGLQGFAESKISLEGMEFNSLAEMFQIAEGLTMEEAEEITEEYCGNFGLQHITKEEYESLITA